jgi:hypothetical protein
MYIVCKKKDRTVNNTYIMQVCNKVVVVVVVVVAVVVVEKAMLIGLWR